MTPEQLQWLRAYHCQQDTIQLLPQSPPPKQSLGTLETIGYTESSAARRVAEFLQRPFTRLIDIRFSPRSRMWAWNKSALEAIYGVPEDAARYRHFKGLGNINYKHPELPITLYEPDPFAQELADLLQTGYSLLLLCVCKHYEMCHRKVVYELVLSKLAVGRGVGWVVS